MAAEGALGGTLGKIADTRVAGVPVGAAAIGAACAGLTDAVIGMVQGLVPAGTLSTTTKTGIADAVGSFAWIKWGDKLVGKTTAEITALFLAYDAIQNFIDIRGKVAGLLGGISLGAGPRKLGANVRVNPTSATGPMIPPRIPSNRYTVPESIDEYVRSRGGA